MSRAAPFPFLAPAAQVGLVAGGLAALLLAPPAQGRFWLVPVTAGARAAVAPVAIARGARLVAAGPAGSLVVAGRRSALWRPMLARGVLVLAAPPAGCAGPAGIADA